MSAKITNIHPQYIKYHNILNSFGEISAKSVSAMPIEIRKALRNNSPVRLVELAKLNCFAAKTIKNYFDEKYGKNKYVIVSLGRSASSITEFMKSIGADVRDLPLSGLRFIEPQNVKITEESFQIFKNYLNKIGLNKELLAKNKQKTYILMDYTNYGRTLKRAEEFLLQPDLLDNAPNFVAIPIKIPLGESYTEKFFDFFFQTSTFKEFATVGKLDIHNLSQIFVQACSENLPVNQGNITKFMHKLFWFNVYDSYKCKSYKSVNPITELKSVYERNFSQNAIRRLIQKDTKKLNKVYSGNK